MAKIYIRPVDPTAVDKKHGFRPWVQVDANLPMEMIWAFFGKGFVGALEVKR